MIKVTVGEQKTQSEKPFPKFVVYDGGKNIVELWEHPIEKGVLIGIHRSGEHKGLICLGFNCDESCTDYNEPITLQNA